MCCEKIQTAQFSCSLLIAQLLPGSVLDTAQGVVYHRGRAADSVTTAVTRSRKASIMDSQLFPLSSGVLMLVLFSSCCSFGLSCTHQSTSTHQLAQALTRKSYTEISSIFQKTWRTEPLILPGGSGRSHRREVWVVNKEGFKRQPRQEGRSSLRDTCASVTGHGLRLCIFMPQEQALRRDHRGFMVCGGFF